MRHPLHWNLSSCHVPPRHSWQDEQLPLRCAIKGQIRRREQDRSIICRLLCQATEPQTERPMHRMHRLSRREGRYFSTRSGRSQGASVNHTDYLTEATPQTSAPTCILKLQVSCCATCSTSTTKKGPASKLQSTCTKSNSQPSHQFATFVTVPPAYYARQVA